MEKNETITKLLASLSDMNGELKYTLTNDYLFRALLQKIEEVLKGFLAAALHLGDEKIIRRVSITNPILLGEAMDEKTCILDIFLVMNDNTKVNIEMQVSRQDGYRNRTLLYLCRAYDDLKQGDAYSQLKPAVHISILDFIPLDGKRKFYSENYLMDVRDHEIYSRNLSVIVIELKEIENAGQAERESGLYQWARLFKAQTWEELKEVAKESETMAKAVVTLKDLSEDDKIKLQCEARYRYEHDMASMRELGRKEGREEGREEGKKEGREEGQNEGLEIGVVILDELEAGMSEKEILGQLVREFSMTPEKAEYYLRRYVRRK